ncbi:hypothetical protein [Deinococcus actinosclerus]|uniref:hypothetical protein n=1 Tax=Deinococcus actinosclerus TaxID=1768108 RepID=UPI000B0EBF5C|nr:hypothetical protein [Deinococcus actinosclerus]
MTSSPPDRPLPPPLLAFLTLCGILGQQVTTPLGVWWWTWAVIPPTMLLTGLLLGKRQGSRLYAAGVALTTGWMIGALLRLILWAAITLSMRSAVG